MLVRYFPLAILFQFAVCDKNNGRLLSQRRVIPRNIPEDFFCKQEGTKLCASDLKGYFVCSAWEYVDDYVRCPPNTQCSCHLDGACKMDPICRPVFKPYPMYTRAEFHFDGTTKLHHYERDPEGHPEEHALQGIVRQDVRAKRFVQIINKVHGGGKTFEIIVPDRWRRNKFYKYSGDADKNCKKEVLDKFEPFAMDLDNYIRDKNLTKQIGPETENTWEYKIGYKVGEQFIREQWKWVFRQVSYTRQSKPLRSVYFRDGDVDEDGKRYSETQDVQWTYRRLGYRWGSAEDWYDRFFPYRVPWYALPWFCENL